MPNHTDPPYRPRESRENPEPEQFVFKTFKDEQERTRQFTEAFTDQNSILQEAIANHMKELERQNKRVKRYTVLFGILLYLSITALLALWITTVQDEFDLHASFNAWWVTVMVVSTILNLSSFTSSFKKEMDEDA